MIGPQSRRAGAVALIAAAATAGAALAQAPATPAGNLGGGALAVPVSAKTVAKDMLLALRVGADGTVGLDGQMFARCAVGTMKGAAKLDAGGAFTLRGTVSRRLFARARQTTRFVVRGRLTADGAEGTAKLDVRLREKGSPTRTCRSRTVAWTLRRPGPASAAAASPAASTLYGVTSQRASRARRPVVLRTAGDGRTIERFTFGYRVSCDRRRIALSDALNVSPEFGVRAGGSFRKVERFEERFPDVIVRTTVVVRGQFDAAGAAAGKLSVTERYHRRRTGKRVDVCRTGARTWSARP